MDRPLEGGGGGGGITGMNMFRHPDVGQVSETGSLYEG